jgi:hypothetical protein
MAALVTDRLRSTRRPTGPAASQYRPQRRRETVQLHPPVTSRALRHRLDRPVAAAVVVLAFLLLGGSIVDAAAGVVGEETSAAPLAPAPALMVEGHVQLVRPGQTYWSIAESLGGSGDIRERVDALQAANEGRVLRAGDRLVVPALE